MAGHEEKDVEVTTDPDAVDEDDTEGQLQRASWTTSTFKSSRTYEEIPPAKMRPPKTAEPEVREGDRGGSEHH